MRERPNFILFITDQHRADFLGCYGHPVLRTPHIVQVFEVGTATMMSAKGAIVPVAKVMADAMER